jgi:hypothetical protein
MHTGALAHETPTAEVDWLDGDMSPTDLAQALRQLRFPSSAQGFRVIRLDASARDYLADCIELRCGRHD